MKIVCINNIKPQVKGWFNNINIIEHIIIIIIKVRISDISLYKILILEINEISFIYLKF